MEHRSRAVLPREAQYLTALRVVQLGMKISPEILASVHLGNGNEMLANVGTNDALPKNNTHAFHFQRNY